MPLANTTYGFQVPEGTYELLIKLRSVSAVLFYFWAENDFGSGTYVTLPQGQSRVLRGRLAQKHLYIRSSSASQTLEVEYLTENSI